MHKVNEIYRGSSLFFLLIMFQTIMQCIKIFLYYIPGIFSQICVRTWRNLSPCHHFPFLHQSVTILDNQES